MHLTTRHILTIQTNLVKAGFLHEHQVTGELHASTYAAYEGWALRNNVDPRYAKEFPGNVEAVPSALLIDEDDADSVAEAATGDTAEVTTANAPTTNPNKSEATPKKHK